MNLSLQIRRGITLSLKPPLEEVASLDLELTDEQF